MEDENDVCTEVDGYSDSGSSADCGNSKTAAYHDILILLSSLDVEARHQDECTKVHSKGEEEKRGDKKLENFCKDVTISEEAVEKKDSPTPVSKGTDILSRVSEISPAHLDSINAASRKPSIHPNLHWAEMAGVNSRNTASDESILKPDVLLCSQPQQGIPLLGLNSLNESPKQPSFHWEQEMKRKESEMQSLKENWDEEKQKREKLEVDLAHLKTCLRNQLLLIEQLSREKEQVKAGSQELANQLKVLQERHEDELEKMKENHKGDIQRVRSLYSVKDRLNTEQWLAAKTKEIKEMTVRGLAPEIQRLLSSQKVEVEALKKSMAREWEDREKELKKSKLKEQEEACQRERDAARTRYERELEKELEVHEKRRVRLMEQFEREKQAWENELMRMMKEGREAHERERRSFEAELEELTSRYNEKLQHLKEFHQEEMRQRIEESVNVEKEAWEKKLERLEGKWIFEKEMEIEAVKRMQMSERATLQDQLEASFQQKLMDLEEGQRKEREDWTKRMEEMHLMLEQETTRYSHILHDKASLQELLESLKTDLQSSAQRLAESEEEKRRLQEETEDIIASRIKEIMKERDAWKEEALRIAQEKQILIQNHERELQIIDLRLREAFKQKGQMYLTPRQQQ